MPPRRPRVKAEAPTLAADYPTPGPSIRSASTVIPRKREDTTIEILSEDDSDETPPKPCKTRPSEDREDPHYPAEQYSHTTPDNAPPSTQMGRPQADPRGHPIPSSMPQAQPPARTLGAIPMEPQVAALEIVGRDVKALISTIDKLKQIGLQSVEHSLPELILVGDQSAGKSSLMGALTEINLPKGQSICTRCPTNIRISAAPTWSCKVSLRLSYAWSHTKNKKQPFPNWIDRETVETHLFSLIYDKDDLEEVLKWAQSALLNPNQDFQTFIPGSAEQKDRMQRRMPDEAKFSPNVIQVEIASPGLSALSFYDLPGLFQVSEDPNQQYLVEVFQQLTAKYIAHPNALIICTITMANDPGLSATRAIIMTKKASDRCIGVLTMPDRLQDRESAHQDYDNILHGKTFVLPLGYFVTKQPGPGSKINGPNYHTLAGLEEEKFFDTDPLWGPDGQWAQFRDRCGTKAIQRYVSKQFAAKILERYVCPRATGGVLSPPPCRPPPPIESQARLIGI
jgi:GTPase SAR1 family protein